MDLLASCVIGHPRPGTRQRMLSESCRAVLCRIATDRDDVVARVRGRPAGHVQLGVIDPVTSASPCAPPFIATVEITDVRVGSGT